jgi:hypothetical protein
MKRLISLILLPTITLLTAALLCGCGIVGPGADVNNKNAFEKGSLRVTIPIPIPNNSDQPGISTLAYELSYVVVTLRNMSNNEEMSMTEDILGDTVVVEFPVVNPGEWTIEATVWGDRKGDEIYRIYWGFGKGVVEYGEVTVIELRMSFAPGVVVVNAYKPSQAYAGVAKLFAGNGDKIGEESLSPPASGDYYTASLIGVAVGVRDLLVVWVDEGGATVATTDKIAVPILPGRTSSVTIYEDHYVIN